MNEHECDDQALIGINEYKRDFHLEPPAISKYFYSAIAIIDDKKVKQATWTCLQNFQTFKFLFYGKATRLNSIFWRNR